MLFRFRARMKNINTDENQLKQLFLSLLILITSLSLCSCNSGSHSNSNNNSDDDATSGTIKIAVDEAYQPLINTEVDTFTKLYRYAKINAVYESETDAFQGPHQ